MHAAFAVHPCGPQLFADFILGVFRHPKPEIRIERDRGVYVVREDVEMVDPQRFDPAIERILLVDRGKAIHLVIELQRNAHVVRGQEGAALIGAIHPLRRTALGAEIRFRPVQIILVECLEAHHLNRTRLVGFLEDDAVVAPFLHRAQIHVRVGLISDLQAEDFGVEGFGGRQISNIQAGVAEADGVEIGVEVRGGYGHVGILSLLGAKCGQGVAVFAGQPLLRCVIQQFQSVRA